MDTFDFQQVTLMMFVSVSKFGKINLFCNKFAARSILYLPPYLKQVTTLDRGPRNNICYSGHVKYFSDWLIDWLTTLRNFCCGHVRLSASHSDDVRECIQVWENKPDIHWSWVSNTESKINSAYYLPCRVTDLVAIAFCHAWCLWRVLYLLARRIAHLIQSSFSKGRHLLSFHQACSS